MRVWEIGSGSALALKRRWTPIRSKRRPGAPLIGPLASPVGAFHPQPAGTAPGDDDGGGMSLAIRTRLYAARAISAQRPLQRLGRVEVGETMEGDLRLNLQQGVASVETLQAAVAHCGQARDFATGGILEGMTVHQAEDIDWLETQLETIRQIGIEEYLGHQIKKEEYAPQPGRTSGSARPAGQTRPRRGRSSRCPPSQGHGRGLGRLSRRRALIAYC